jgi:hypothetical protein
MRRAVLPVLCFAALQAFAADEGSATLQGQVTDPSGALVPGVKISVSNGGGFAREMHTDSMGRFSMNGLPPGKYDLRAARSGFSEFEDPKVQLQPGHVRTLNISLALEGIQQQVTVSDANSNRLSVDPASNAGAVILREADLEALPDDPDDFEEALKALAGPSVGPNGAQFFIDGFSGGHIPPKESIREIRINENPFSAEYDKLGFGRIEIFTKPGTDKFRGMLYTRFSDAAMNSRNPYGLTKPPYQSRELGGDVSGPLTRRSSFFWISSDVTSTRTCSSMHLSWIPRSKSPRSISL